MSLYTSIFVLSQDTFVSKMFRAAQVAVNTVFSPEFPVRAPEWSDDLLIDSALRGFDNTFQKVLAMLKKGCFSIPMQVQAIFEVGRRCDSSCSPFRIFRNSQLVFLQLVSMQTAPDSTCWGSSFKGFFQVSDIDTRREMAAFTYDLLLGNAQKYPKIPNSAC